MLYSVCKQSIWPLNKDGHYPSTNANKFDTTSSKNQNQTGHYQVKAAIKQSNNGSSKATASLSAINHSEANIRPKSGTSN